MSVWIEKIKKCYLILLQALLLLEKKIPSLQIVINQKIWIEMIRCSCSVKINDFYNKFAFKNHWLVTYNDRRISPAWHVTFPTLNEITYTVYHYISAGMFSSTAFHCVVKAVVFWWWFDDDLWCGWIITKFSVSVFTVMSYYWY